MNDTVCLETADEKEIANVFHDVSSMNTAVASVVVFSLTKHYMQIFVFFWECDA